jgi:DDE_Tnp_1-associated
LEDEATEGNAAGALTETTVFLPHFDDLPDYRQKGKAAYPLDEVLLVMLAAALAGAETVADIARFGRAKLAFLRRFRPANSPSGRVSRPSLAHPYGKHSRKQRQVDPVHQPRQPAAAGNAEMIGEVGGILGRDHPATDGRLHRSRHSTDELVKRLESRRLKL